MPSSRERNDSTTSSLRRNLTSPSTSSTPDAGGAVASVVRSMIGAVFSVRSESSPVALTRAS